MGVSSSSSLALSHNQLCGLRWIMLVRLSRFPCEMRRMAMNSKVASSSMIQDSALLSTTQGMFYHKKQWRKISSTLRGLVFSYHLFITRSMFGRYCFSGEDIFQTGVASVSDIRPVVSSRAFQNWLREKERTPHLARGQASWQDHPTPKDKDSGSRYFTGLLQLYGKRNTVDGSPPFTKQGNICLLLVFFSLCGGFS